MKEQKFCFLPDIHYGFETGVDRRRTPIHSTRCLDLVGSFLGDFKPDVLIFGGDSLDLGAISHHNRTRKRSIEALRIQEDAREFARKVLLPFEAAADATDRRFLIGNHERFLQDVVEDYPGLEGVLSVESLLPLYSYDVIPLGGFTRLGKLFFCHGDQLKGGQNHAKATVTTYNRSLRYGHFHTFQAATRTDPLDVTDFHTAISVPALCDRGPGYGRGAANAWINGFCWGHVHPDGSFSDHITILPQRGKVTINGKKY